MPLDEAVANRPFAQCYYNLPKLPPLPPLKRVDYRQTPKTAINETQTSKLRRRLIDIAKKKKIKDAQPSVYQHLTQKMLQKIAELPPIEAKPTKTYQYRYKLGRDIPVISCRFIEHMMMYRKPPFAHLRYDADGQFKIRKTKLVNEKLTGAKPQVLAKK